MKKSNKITLIIVLIFMVVLIGIGTWYFMSALNKANERISELEKNSENIDVAENNKSTETNNNSPISSNKVKNTIDNNESTNNKEGTNNTTKKLSYDDLKVDNLTYGMTERQVVEILGEPDEKTKGDEFDVKGDSVNYQYGDLLLSFYYDKDNNLVLSCAGTESSKYTFSRGLKVGDSKEKVLSSFYRESTNENDLRDIISSYDTAKPFGKYLYGHAIDTIDGIKQSGNVEYAFINYYGYDKTNPESSYMIEYHYAEPPYSGEYAHSSEVNGTLIFDMNSEDKVKCIRWYRYAK